MLFWCEVVVSVVHGAVALWRQGLDAVRQHPREHEQHGDVQVDLGHTGGRGQEGGAEVMNNLERFCH